MSFPRLAASHNRPIQGRRNRRGGCCGFWRSSSFNCGSSFQHATPECLGILAGIDGEHLHQQVGGSSVRHESRHMRLKLLQFRRRTTMRRPAIARLDLAAGHAAKSRQTYHDLAEQRRDSTRSIVLDPAAAAALRTGRQMGAMIRGLLGNDLLLDGSQQRLRLGQGQPKVRHGAEPIGSLECHHIVAACLTLYTDFYQPHDPGHAFTPGIG